MKTITMALWDVDISKISAISTIKSSGTVDTQWYFFTVMVEGVDINSKSLTNRGEVEKIRMGLLTEWKEIKPNVNK